MCKWYCTSEGPSTNLRCRSCGCSYCSACLHGDAGKMKSLTECARCKKKPTVAPVGQNTTWQSAAASIQSSAIAEQGADLAVGASARLHAHVVSLRSSSQNYPMSRTPEAPVPTNRPRTPSFSWLTPGANSSAHRDQVDRVKMACHVCGYKCFPQWLNDKAHCLKCDAVLKKRPSCQQRQTQLTRPASGTKPCLRTRHAVRDLFHKFDVNGDGIIRLAEFKEVLDGLPVPPGGQAFHDADSSLLLRHG